MIVPATSTRADEPVCAARVSIPDRASLWGSPLDRIVSIRLTDSPLREALERVAVVAKVELSYSNELLPRLVVHRRLDRVAVHPTCGTEKNGTHAALLELARACGHEVVIADSWGCCAFAGDRGMLHPELTASATSHEAAELIAARADAYVSDNRGCQVAMSRSVGREFRHIVELFDDLTR